MDVATIEIPTDDAATRRANRRERQREAFVAAVARPGPRRIVIGASGHFDPGWIPSEAHILDLLRPDDWAAHLADGSVDALLAEHVWEHLTPADGVAAARTCHRFLRPGGTLRVAVPDGLHPDPAYVDWVRPGGVGPGADDHRVLYTYRTFAAVFAAAGFDVRLLEHFDEGGAFHFADWDPSDGKVERSIRFDERNVGGVLRYTSLMLDAVKR